MHSASLVLTVLCYTSIPPDLISLFSCTRVFRIGALYLYLHYSLLISLVLSFNVILIVPKQGRSSRPGQAAQGQAEDDGDDRPPPLHDPRR